MWRKIPFYFRLERSAILRVMTQQERIHIFVECIWKWFAEHKRALPWRDLQIEDDMQRAYQILVSEIMLQQTQVSRVKIAYRNFLEKFPTVSDLASASNAEVILAWRGMGYNNRALRLRDCAQEICKREQGDMATWQVDTTNHVTVLPCSSFPIEMHELQSLPGVGHYTAAAIRNFAFNIPTPCLDTNIRRILHRTFYGPENRNGEWKIDDGKLLTLAEKILQVAIQNTKYEIRDTRNWHAALMDFGSLVCTKRNPKWDICPLTKAGIMKAAYKIENVKWRMENKKRREPGRFVGSKFIPNRIFRGKIIEELRDNPSGLSHAEIGRRICIDWDPSEHTEWLESLILALTKDNLIERNRNIISLPTP